MQREPELVPPPSKSLHFVLELPLNRTGASGRTTDNIATSAYPPRIQTNHNPIADTMRGAPPPIEATHPARVPGPIREQSGRDRCARCISSDSLCIVRPGKRACEVCSSKRSKCTLVDDVDAAGKNSPKDGKGNEKGKGKRAAEDSVRSENESDRDTVSPANHAPLKSRRKTVDTNGTNHNQDVNQHLVRDSSLLATSAGPSTINSHSMPIWGVQGTLLSEDRQRNSAVSCIRRNDEGENQPGNEQLRDMPPPPPLLQKRPTLAELSDAAAVAANEATNPDTRETRRTESGLSHAPTPALLPMHAAVPQPQLGRASTQPTVEAPQALVEANSQLHAIARAHQSCTHPWSRSQSHSELGQSTDATMVPGVNRSGTSDGIIPRMAASSMRTLGNTTEMSSSSSCQQQQQIAIPSSTTSTPLPTTPLTSSVFLLNPLTSTPTPARTVTTVYDAPLPDTLPALRAHLIRLEAQFDEEKSALTRKRGEIMRLKREVEQEEEDLADADHKVKKCKRMVSRMERKEMEREWEGAEMGLF